MSHWADQYVGLPFKERGRDKTGLDCWGLTRLVLAERAGLVLPMWDGSEDSVEAVSREAANFKEIPIDDAQELDVVIMLEEVRMGLGWELHPVHTGLVITPRTVLHIRKNSHSCIEPFTRLRIVSVRTSPHFAR